MRRKLSDCVNDMTVWAKTLESESGDVRERVSAELAILNTRLLFARMVVGKGCEAALREEQAKANKKAKELLETASSAGADCSWESYSPLCKAERPAREFSCWEP